MTTAPTHALRRTSPKGGPFFGTCLQCGETNLPIGATYHVDVYHYYVDRDKTK